LAQRPLCPVGEARGFVDMRAGELAGERLVADAVAEAAYHGGDLGVEERRRHRTRQVDEDLDVLPRRVEDLEQGGGGHQREKRPQVDAGRQRVERGGLVGAGDLHQAELREIGLVADEFRVDRDVGGLGLAAAEGGEGGTGIDQRHRRAIHRNSGADKAAPRAAGEGRRRLDNARSPCAFPAFPATRDWLTPMHAYRTHTCGAPRLGDAGRELRLAGWVHRKRDHGQLLFIDLRDHYGITQCVIDSSSPLFPLADAQRLESVISVTGTIVKRSPETVNAKLPTGEVELQIAELTVLSEAEPLPFPVNAEAEYPEEMRLKYRFLDLRRDSIHANIMLRSNVIASLRRRMIAQGFAEFQTPILTASSPEGARDYLVPSRLHPGKFYALPQAPQQFKQLLMVAGFDRYFQIAPCFRDEASRADRSPGEFYQLDFEMSFV